MASQDYQDVRGSHWLDLKESPDFLVEMVWMVLMGLKGIQVRKGFTNKVKYKERQCDVKLLKPCV